MGVSLQDIREGELIYEDGTEGGGTYYLNGRPLCLAALRGESGKDQHCSMLAGRGTEHVGTGRCSHHGGRFDPRLTGRWSKHLKAKLREQYEDFITDPDILDLTPELALQRALLAEMTELYQTGQLKGIISDGMVRRMLATLKDVGEMVERIERIKSTHIITAATARLLIVKGLEVAKRFIQEDRVQEFVMAWHREVHGMLAGERAEGLEAPAVLDGQYKVLEDK